MTHKATIPGVGDVEGAGGFIDLRTVPNADLRRAAEVALMNDPPLAIVLTPEQRASLAEVQNIAVALHTEGEGETAVKRPVVASMPKAVNKDGREVIALTGHGKHSEIVLVQVEGFGEAVAEKKPEDGKR